MIRLATQKMIGVIALSLLSLGLYSCSQKFEPSVVYESNRQLVYTDKLLAQKGTVFVNYGSRERGQFPSSEQQSDITFIEELLSEKGFRPTSNNTEADYIFYVDTPKFDSTSWNPVRANLVKQYKTRAEIINNHGINRKGMWSAEVNLAFENLDDITLHKRNIFKKLILMFPHRTERTKLTLSSLES